MDWTQLYWSAVMFNSVITLLGSPTWRTLTLAALLVSIYEALASSDVTVVMEQSSL